MKVLQLQKEIHALARAKGWYEDRDLNDPRTLGSMKALIHSEVSEALECVRKGDLRMRLTTNIIDQDGTLGPPKPEGLPSELADVVIRVLDLLEAHPPRRLYCEPADYSTAGPRDTSALTAGHRLNDMHDRVSAERWTALVHLCYDMAWHFDFDLDEAIVLKHAFNQTRPHRHGNKAL